MSAIIINSDSANLRILAEFLFGRMMDSEKTGKNVSREEILKQLSKKEES